MKNLRKLVSLLLVVLFVSACASSIAQERVTVKMWTFLDPVNGTSGREVALKRMIDSFEAQYDIDVVVEPQTWSTLSAKFMSAASIGNAPDIIWLNADNLGAAIDLDLLEPFENLFMKDWTEKEYADADTTFFQYGATADAHYQMAFSRNFIGLIVRTDLLEEAGYSVPFENWDQFREVAKVLTAENDALTGTKRYGYGLGFTVDGADSQLISNMILDANGSLYNADGTANWANEAGVKGIELIRDMMFTDASISEVNLTQSVEDVYKDFMAGKYAMINGATSRLAVLKAGCVFDPTTITIVPYPSDVNSWSKSCLAGWCVGVWSGSAKKEEAGLFVEWMFQPENDVLWVELGGQPAMMNSTASLINDLPASTQAAINCLNTAGWMPPADFAVTGWRSDMNQALQDVLVNGMSPVDALNAAEAAFNERNK